MFEGFGFPMKTIEGYEFKPDANEGTKDFSNNILALQEKSDTFNKIDVDIHQKYREIQNSVNDLKSDYNTTYRIRKYKNIEIPDKTDLVKTTKDVREQDIHNLLAQQNYIYIVGSITCATLLIAAIVIGRE
jgi:hypothetical protein